MSPGSRQTRKKRRARRKRARLRESAGAVLRGWPSIFVGTTIIVARATPGRSVRGSLSFVALLSSVAGEVTPVLAGSGRAVLGALARAASVGFARDPLLFVALLGSGLAAVACVLGGKGELAILFCVSAQVLCAALWVSSRDKGGSEREGGDRH